MKKNTFIHGIYTLCTAGLIALLFSAGCSGLSADILRGGTDTETGGTQTAGKTVSVSFDCTDGARMVFPSPALTDYTYTVTGTVSGGSAETLLTGKTYAEVTASGAVTVDPGSWTFTVAAYSGNSEVLAGSVTADLTSGAETLPVTLYAVTGGTGSVSVTLNYPAGKGVTKVTAALYDSPVEADREAGQTITTGTDTDSVTFMAANVPSATAKFVRFFLYDAQKVCLGSYTDSVYVVAGLTSTAAETLSDINMFGVTVNIRKDGSAWVGSGKVITLKKDSLSYDLTNASGSNAATGSVPYGTYEVYADGTDTGGTLTAETDGSAQADVDYYTVTLPTVTGCTIAAKSGSESPVLSGRSYSFTVTLSTGYTDSPVSVTANGITPTVDTSVYIIKNITAAQTVAVSGVTGNVYAVTLDNQSATTAGTGTIYEKYGAGFYLESDCTNKMSTSANGITVPVKSGYTFGGYYTATGGSGTQYVGAAGKLTADEGTEPFTAAGTLYSKWIWNSEITSLTASTGDGEATLSWTTPGDSGFASIVVSWTPVTGTGSTTVTGVTAGGTASTEITGLANGTSYTFTVKAVDTAGNESSGVSLTRNIFKPAQPPVQGEATLPTITAAITDHLYLASSAAGTEGRLAGKVSGAVTNCQWYTSTDNSNWSEYKNKINGRTESYVYTGIKITSDSTVYYYVKITNGDSMVYSNVCTVECGTAKTKKIGWIYYTDGSVSSSYNNSLTPAGIVCDVKTDGSVKTIVALTNSYNEWAKQNSVTTLATSLTDGKTNTELVKKLPDYDKSNYPVFDYCDKNTAWYLPALDELHNICFNNIAINAGLSTLYDSGVKEADELKKAYYWSSSLGVSSEKTYVWIIYFHNGSINCDESFSLKCYARYVAGF